jgi:hypothetical protein
MNAHELINGYKKIIHDIYTAKPYYKRIRQLLMNYNSGYKKPARITFVDLSAAVKSILIIGLRNKGRRHYWKLMIWTLFRRPVLIADALTFSIYGYHYRKIFGLSA